MLNAQLNLFNDDSERHKRHILLKEIGGVGLKQLKSASVSIVGAGALGGPCALYLAAAGVGLITIYDDDIVDLSNLQRQIQFETNNIGSSKSGLLAERLAALNPSTAIQVVEKRYCFDDQLNGTIIIDASDNYPTRFAINRAAHASHRVLVSGAAARWGGQVAAFNSGNENATPCYQCFVPQEPPQSETCEEIGVVGAVTGIVGTRMALETIKIIVGTDTNLLGKLWIFDGLSGDNRIVSLSQDPMCITCGNVL